MSISQFMQELQLLVQQQSLLMLIVGGGSILVCLLLTFVLWRGHRKNQALQQKLLRLEREFKVANGSAIGMGQHLIALEKQLYQQQYQVQTQAQVQTPQNSVPTAAATEADSVSAEPPESSSLKVQSQEASAASEEEISSSIYDDARRALANGRTVSEVAKQCGLSYAEVSLLQALSKQSIASP